MRDWLDITGAARRCGELLDEIEPAHGANQNIEDGAGPNVLTRTDAANGAGLSERHRGQAAGRMRRHRARERNGRVVLRIEAVELDLVHALIASGALAHGDADDRHKVERAVERLLSDWSAAWAERV